MILGALESLESRLSNAHKIIKICCQQLSMIKGGRVLEQICPPVTLHCWLATGTSGSVLEQVQNLLQYLTTLNLTNLEYSNLNYLGLIGKLSN